MQIYGPTHLHGAQPISAPHRGRVDSAPQTTSVSQGSDQLDISDAGRVMNMLSEIPDIRQDRVNQLRAAIAGGRYETDDKLGAALDRLLDEIG